MGSDPALPQPRLALPPSSCVSCPNTILPASGSQDWGLVACGPTALTDTVVICVPKERL